MDLPPSVQVGPFKFAVDKHAPNDKMGQADFDLLTIHVSPHQPLDGQRETLMHELIHACLHTVGFSEQMSEKKEERLVRALSPLLLDTLRRNKRLREYLLA